MTVYIDIIEAYTIHAAIIARAKTKATVRDFALLHSAVERPKATFNGKLLYPTIFAKAAGLLQSICLNHAFTDGNKRTAWGVTKRFLWMNGYRLHAPPHEAADFMVSVDNRKPTVQAITVWLKDHSDKKT
jgi:death-on-curing protein